MEPDLCSDIHVPGAVNDTGQSSPIVVAAESTPELSTGEDIVNKQDGLKDTTTSSDECIQSSSRPTEGVLFEDECVLLEDNSRLEKVGSESAICSDQARVESLESNQEDCARVWGCNPKIIVEMEGEESRELASPNDDDLDPLITLDDSESQSSDLINFDTVSYDVFQQPAGEDEDDERSIATMSSLSCEMKMDSPAKHSQSSNSSSLDNLLDPILKETGGAAASPTENSLMEVIGSAASSCPSSPSLRSSKTMSSAVDESISEAVSEKIAEELNEKLEVVANCTSSEEAEKPSLCSGETAAEINITDTFTQTPPSSCDKVPALEGLEETGPQQTPIQEILSNSTNNDTSSDLEKRLQTSSGMTVNVQDSSDSSDGSEPVDVHKESESKDEDSQENLETEESVDVSDHRFEDRDAEEVRSLPEENSSVPCVVRLLNEDSVSMGGEGSSDNSQTTGTPMNDGAVVEPVSTSLLNERDEIISKLESNTVIPSNEDVSSEDTIVCDNTLLECSENIVSDVSDKISDISEPPSVGETYDISQTARTPPVDSAISVSITTEEASELKSSSEAAGISPTKAVSITSSEILPAEQVLSSGAVSTTVSEKTSSPEQPSALDLNDIPCNSPSSPKMTSDIGKLQDTCCPNPVNTPQLYSFKGNLSSVEKGDESAETEPGVLKDEEGEDLLTSHLEVSFKCDPDASGESISSCDKDDYSMEEDNKNKLDQAEIGEACLMKSGTSLENLAGQMKRPTTLPDINSAKSEKTGMNFSEFLGLVHVSTLNKSNTSKHYSVAALDEAQQMASGLVDDILQLAVLKAEEKIVAHKNLAAKRVEAIEAACALVDEVLVTASVQTLGARETKAKVLKTCDKDNSESDASLTLQETDSAVCCTGLIVDDLSVASNSSKALSENAKEASPTTNSPPIYCSEDESNSLLPDSAVEMETSLSPLQPEISDETTLEHPIPQMLNKDASLSLSNDSSEIDLNVTDKCSSDTLNNSGGSSLSGSLMDVHPKESKQNSSSDNGANDSVRSSLLTCSDMGLRSEASLFIDGVLEEAVKKYEESTSSESSPVKLKLNLDSDFLLDEEELATPCGEMLTEHFMDFESGRNVSVFCSLPEIGSENHILAYDRTAHNIGNREVDSGTGKSVSVFRIEEDVYYEVQRPSTCTSVFESVEEEDEDMIDTTVPVEDRPNRTMKTSVSFPSFDRDKLDISDCDAFEDAVGAFLAKERLGRNETRRTLISEIRDSGEETNPCRALVLKHPVIDLSNQEEKKRMAEKWANGGESEVPDTPEMRDKQKAIREALDSDENVAVKLCQLALTEGGLLNDLLRREAWPRMLGLDPTLEIDAPLLEDLKSHPEYEQVVLDVNRSLKRFPPDIPKDRRETLQDKLTRLIMYVISKHPHLRYYQGYHDVAVTFLLVVGESVAFQIMERLSTEHLSDCMQPTMERTSFLLHFIYPLLHRIHPTLADYLERSQVGTMFCLPWFLTWFGHSLDRYQDVVRLYDHFLASPPLAPLYVAAVLVAHRADEVLAVDCDMAAIHALLSHIPDSLPLEILLRDATELYFKFPPESIEREVEERFKNEQEMRNNDILNRRKIQNNRMIRHRRGQSHGGGPWQLAEMNRLGGTMMAFNGWIPPWVVQQQRLSLRLLFASATFFVGFYVYSRGGDMLPYM